MVQRCGSGEEALAFCLHAVPDAILMDVHMPLLDAATMIQIMKSEGISHLVNIYFGKPRGEVALADEKNGRFLFDDRFMEDFETVTKRALIDN